MADRDTDEVSTPVLDHEQERFAEATRSTSTTRVALRIGVRVVLVVAILALTAWALFNIFEDLDFGEIQQALDRLSDAEWLALGFGWLIWVGAQGLQTASLVHHLPARRGVLASLGPTAVSSLIPGPSDLPVRYSMYQSWGVSTNEAATAVAASGIFSVGSQLILPALAGLAIFFGNIEIDGFLTIIVVATLVLAVLIVVVAFVLGSERRTERAARALDRPWRAGHRLLRRDVPEQGALAETVVRQRRLSLDHLRDKWLKTSGATILTQATKCSLLIMALRFVGIPEEDLGWAAIFAVYSLVAGLTVVPITPGSAGVAEIALVGMLTPIAGQEYVNEVAAGVLLYRMMTWILIIPAGGIALLGWRISRRQASA